MARLRPPTARWRMALTGVPAFLETIYEKYVFRSPLSILPCSNPFNRPLSTSIHDLGVDQGLFLRGF